MITLDFSNLWIYIGPGLFVAIHWLWKRAWYTTCGTCHAVVPRGEIEWMHYRWHQQTQSQIDDARHGLRGQR